MAAAPEKAGSYLDWEGRVRSFDATLHDTGRLSDARVLHGLADLMDVDLRLPTPEAARAELAALGTARRPGVAGPDVAAVGAPSLAPTRRCWRPGGSSWTSARCSATSPSSPAPPAAPWSGSPGGRRPPRRSSTATGDRDRARPASVTLPLRVTAMPDHVVWLPMRSPGSEVRTQLGAGPGAVVAASPPPPTPAGAA